MKKAAAILCAAAMLCAADVPQMAVYARINDPKYDTYSNMNVTSTGHPQYVVPNLYRGDAAYNNDKQYPLVVSTGVEYVPVDIFAQFSYLNVTYSRVGYGFYISNTRNGKYIAFDLDSGTTSTNDLLSVDIDSNIYYSTNYVPADEVCSVLGLHFESYDDEEKGIRAARISGSSSEYTLEDLVTMYSPVKRTDEAVTPPQTDTSAEQKVSGTEERKEEPAAAGEKAGTSVMSATGGTSGTSANTSGTAQTKKTETKQIEKTTDKTQTKASDKAEDKASDKTDDKESGKAEEKEYAERDGNVGEETEEKTAPADPFETAAARQVYLLIDASAPNTSAEQMLAVLGQSGRRALFLVSPQADASEESSRADAAAIRSLLMDGHEIGLSFETRDRSGALKSGEDIIAELEEKNTLLALYGKRKTRFVYTASDRDALAGNETEKLLEEHGFVLLPDVPRYGAGADAKMITERICGIAPHIAKSVGVCLPVGAEKTLVSLLALFDRYHAFHIRVPDEFMKLTD